MLLLSIYVDAVVGLRIGLDLGAGLDVKVHF